MSSSLGTTLTVTVFGQSHSPAIGCTVEGVPSGFKVDLDALQAFLDRRAPGRTPWSTPRKEPDAIKVLSGLNYKGETCGAPFTAVIENTNTRSADYDDIARIPRPGHADFTAWAKWGPAHDVRGGGAFSGRLTAPLCIAGGLALQLLATRGVRIGAHLDEVAGIGDDPFFASVNTPQARALLGRQLDDLADGRSFPTINEEAGQRMVDAILEAQAAGDSVGAVIECVACGLPAGIGAPPFDGIENSLARALFGIPAVKGLEFGAGFEAARLRGSENNDPYQVEDGQISPRTNNAGGALGGITSGAPISFRLAIKPTPSIALEQDSVNLVTGKPAKLAVTGRHDPCVAPRAVPVVEAVCALVLLDSWLSWPPEIGPFSKRAL